MGGILDKDLVGELVLWGILGMKMTEVMRLKKKETCRHHAIYVKDKWCLPKVNSDVFTWLLHSHGRKELPLDLSECSSFPQRQYCTRQDLAILQT